MATFTSGTRLGPYEIIDAIGAGGMGEVYRARDTRLDRTVAIKVLAAGLATDITSRDRFEREAKAISSLNHPNICVLHDVGRDKPSGDAAAVDFLVMEFLDGETLAARLAHGPSRAARQLSTSGGLQLPMTVEEALAIAIQTAAALDCAHRQGIVHRDLKPGNVMLVNGTVKLLDFGLARLSQTGGASSDRGLGHGMVSLADLSMPTVSSPLTLKGTILGTLQYMAPEQLEGKEVDARADIFAFGSILYEMLTGRKAFEGKSQASLIGAILDQQPPPVTTYQPVSPPILDEIVARCLAKHPDERWQTTRDLKRQLEWVSSRLTDSSMLNAASAAASASAQPSRARTAAYVVGGLLAGAAIAGVTAWMLRPAAVALPPMTRFSLTLPEGQAFTRQGRHVIALSPDGSKLVYVANLQLYLRSMDDLTAKVIAGTESTNPSEPVFSPDGEWIAFFSATELKKIHVGGGTPVPLAKVGNPHGASWQGHRIVFGESTGVVPRGIVEVPDTGGAPKVLVSIGNAEEVQNPQLVSGGRGVLFALKDIKTSWDDADIVVQDLASGRRRVLVEGGTDPYLLPGGRLAFVREATVFAIAFDEEKFAVSGGLVPIERGVQQVGPNASGAAQWAWSASGVLAFVPGDAGNDERALIWIDRQGHEERARAPVRTFNGAAPAMRISPDGTRVAFSVESTTTTPNAAASGSVSTPGANSSRSDIWVWEISRSTLTRLSLTNNAVNPIWTPDGARVCYRSYFDVYCQAADGSSPPEKLVTIEHLGTIASISPDGKSLFSTVLGTTLSDIVITTLGPKPETRPLVRTPFADAAPMVSPDGRWLAYQSNETGRSEVYVRPFPNVDQQKWPVSADGGSAPRWSRDGRELFFSTGGGPEPRLIVGVTVQPGATFSASAPSVVARPPARTASAWDVAPDGRFLFHVPASETTVDRTNEIVVVQRGLDELAARLRPSPQ